MITPISLSTTFAQKSPGEFYPGHFEYARTGNPTRNSFEDCIASLENAKYGVAFASGMAATTTLIHLLKAGDHVITIDDVYGGKIKKNTEKKKKNSNKNKLKKKNLPIN